MKNIVIIFILSSGINLKAQNFISYYKTINNAEIANLNKNYAKSDSIYQIAFKMIERPFKEDFYLAAINSEKLKDNTKTYDYLFKAIQKGLTIERIKTDISFFKNSKEWKKLSSEYDELRKNYLKNLNISIQNEIKEMIAKDQKTRNPIFGSVNKMKKTDNYNFNRILELIQQNGNKWLGFSLIGEETPKGKYNVEDNISLMLLHFEKKQIEQLKPYLFQAVLNGEIYPYQYARIIDYTIGKEISLNRDSNNKIDPEICFLYGTYLNTKICDCNKAEFEREKIGFEPLSDFYRKINSNFQCKK